MASPAAAAELPEVGAVALAAVPSPSAALAAEAPDPVRAPEPVPVIATGVALGLAALGLAGALAANRTGPKLVRPLVRAVLGAAIGLAVAHVAYIGGVLSLRFAVGFVIAAVVIASVLAVERRRTTATLGLAYVMTGTTVMITGSLLLGEPRLLDLVLHAMLAIACATSAAAVELAGGPHDARRADRRTLAARAAHALLGAAAGAGLVPPLAAGTPLGLLAPAGAMLVIALATAKIERDLAVLT